MKIFSEEFKEWTCNENNHHPSWKKKPIDDHHYHCQHRDAITIANFLIENIAGNNKKVFHPKGTKTHNKKRIVDTGKLKNFLKKLLKNLWRVKIYYLIGWNKIIGILLYKQQTKKIYYGFPLFYHLFLFHHRMSKYYFGTTCLCAVVLLLMLPLFLYAPNTKIFKKEQNNNQNTFYIIQQWWWWWKNRKDRHRQPDRHRREEEERKQ